MGEVVIPVADDGGHRVVDVRDLAVCATHGRPPADQWDEDVLGHPTSRWRLLRPTPDLLGRIAEHVNATVRIPTRGWPVCERCSALVRRRALLTRTTLTTGVAAVVVSVLVAAVAGSNPWLTIPFLGGAALVVASLFLAGRVSMLAVTGAHAALDGSGVIVDDPHPAFRAAVAASFP